MVRIDYAPLGGGSHHWLALEASGKRHWITVDDLDHKEFLGDSRAAALAGLRAAFETALALRDAGLEFVVAPCRSVGGDSVQPLGTRYAESARQRWSRFASSSLSVERIIVTGASAARRPARASRPPSRAHSR
jgi:hypothetical protein